jgi:hypothetical protein
MEENKHRVSVIIPNYDRKEHIGRLLQSIASQKFHDYEVIIIDDCSPDRSAILPNIGGFIKDHKNMRLIENKENIGFVRTCNKGIRLAKAEYICILTNDTLVTSDFLAENVKIMDNDKSSGILSCIIVDPQGKNWFSGGMFKKGVHINLRDDFQGIRPVDFVAGTAAFYRREVFDRVGLLDESFHMYHEDVEFCLRVRKGTDYKVCMFADKLVTHYTGLLKTLAYTKFLYYSHRNHMLILKKYFPKYIPMVLLHYIREIIDLLFISISKLQPSYNRFAVPIVMGTISGLLHRKGRNYDLH